MQYGGIQNSPLGEILIIDNGESILEVRFLDSNMKDYSRNNVIIKNSLRKSPLTLKAFLQLEEYFAKERQTFTLPLDPKGTAFQRSVWKILYTIPYGKTLSYGEVAKILGNPKSARAVGNANHHNPITILIPCHRVIGSDGAISGYASGIQRKIELLKLEDRKKELAIL